MVIATGLETISLSLVVIIISGMILQTNLFEDGDLFDNIETAVLAATGIFSLLLVALSISAYRKTGLKRIIYAAIAFSLFAVQLLLESLEETFSVLEETPFTDIVLSSMTLAILVLFFLAIVKKSS